ncbi:Serine proteinase stubble, partial [Stegodyphus mimosarum]
MHQYTASNNSPPNVCEQDMVCCQLTFPEDIDDADLYPVATPIPDRASFPDKRKHHNVCGIRKAYGVQSRLSQLQYPPDVSEFGEYPWQIAVLKKVEGEKNLYLCGGALVSPQWVATVAHCVKNEEIAWLLIRLGEWDVNRKDEIYPYIEEDVTALLIHPEFDEETLENDLALLRIRTPVDPKIPHISPVCLPSYGQAFEGQRCWVSGWGKDFFGPQGEYQNVLKEVDVPILNYGVCNNELRSTKLGPAYILHPSFLCAGGEEGKDACT